MNKFGKENPEAFFIECGSALSAPTETYLLGGGAMCFRNQKNATKDVDLLFLDHGSEARFAESLERLGFSERKDLEKAYIKMRASGIWGRGTEEIRIDMFVGKVCGALALSEGMRKRAEKLGTFGKLEVRIVSNEDMILFKSVTERPDDTNDIAAVVRSANIDWNVILDECKKQSEERFWYGLLLNKLEELNERHKIYAPITCDVERMYEEAVFKEAVELRRKKGLNREQIIAELEERIGEKLTKKELDAIDGK